MRTARAALALLLCFAVPVRAETTSDPLWTMLSTYVLAPDPGAPEGEGDAKGLAGLQADLLLLSEGFEAFRDEEQVKASLEKLHPRMSPQLRPFFRDRASSLDAVYRTLAVTDYTWAGRLPTPPCDPGERRAALLGSEDRLFADEKGESSPWLVSLLGPQAKGQQASAALDQASASARLTPAEYERLRAKARRITLALQFPSAEGLARAKLYCGRADIYEKLAAHHRAAKGGLIEASYSGSFAAVPSVLAVVSKERRGAATVVKGPAGTAVLTDAGLVADTEEPTVFYAGKDGQPVELKAKVKRRHAGLGLAELELSETRPALRLAEKAPAVGDLTSSIGHLQIGGLWTRTSGLVARSGGSSFHTDAAVSPEMLGAPVLNEDGEVAGVLSLRKADNEDGEWLVGVPAPLISRWLAGEEIPETAPPAEEVADSGTAAILSHTRLAPIETGLGAWHIPPMGPPPPTVKGVCVSNCGGGYSRSYSSGGSSSYSSGSGGAELGQALGQALAPLVEALIFRGIPALFRGIASLFKKKPGSSSTAHAAEKKVEKRPAAEKQDPPKPPPPPKPAVCSVSIASAPGSIAAKPVDVVAQVSCVGGEAPKAGHRVAFSVQWDRGPIVNAGATDTDTEGLATLELTVENASTKRMEAVGRADESLDELDRARDRRHEGGDCRSGKPCRVQAEDERTDTESHREADEGRADRQDRGPRRRAGLGRNDHRREPRVDAVALRRGEGSGERARFRSGPRAAR